MFVIITPTLSRNQMFSGVVKLTGATTDATIAMEAVPRATALTICACDSDAQGRTWVRGRMETAFTDALARTVMFILDGCLICTGVLRVDALACTGKHTVVLAQSRAWLQPHDQLT